MLKKNQELKKLLLSSNLLGDSGVTYLADALTVNTGLSMLLLADNPFGDEGGWKMADVLCRSNRSLQVLDIHGTRMTKQAEKQVSSNVGLASSSMGVCLQPLPYTNKEKKFF